MKPMLTDNKGFTLVEVMVVLILLTLSFMVFLRALNTGKTIRANSEIRTVQSVILSSIQNEIRARRYDENLSSPWSSLLGKELGEYEIKEFDDIDDFNGYFEPSFTDYPAFSCSVAVEYVYIGKYLPNAKGKHFELNWMTDSNEKRGTYITDSPSSNVERTNYNWLDPENKSLREVLKGEVSNWWKSLGSDVVPPENTPENGNTNE